VDCLRQDRRDYDGTILSVEETTDRLKKWTALFSQERDAPKVLVYGKDSAASYRQPALSHDRNFVAFVRIGSP
jgi:hypothetical protein